MGSLLKDRVIGSTGLSVGTQLALETLFKDKIMLIDTNRVFTTEDPNNYKYHIYNIYTIVRNIIGSCNSKKDIGSILKDKLFLDTLIQEVNIIGSYYSTTKCVPILFHPNYTKIYKNYHAGKTTGITSSYIEHASIESILTKYSNKINSVNDGKGYKLPTLDNINSIDKILITTNLPVDLFNKYNLYILESHTGKIKNKYEFNSKYRKVGSNDMSWLPYLEELMYIFGDKNMINPLPTKLKKIVLDIGKDKNWTVRTKGEKVVNDLKKDNEIYSLLKKFNKCYS